MINIVLVDDHTIVRQGLKQILSDVADVLVVGEAECGREAIALARTHECAVILLDINLPDQDGLSVLHALKQNNPAQTVLVLSMYSEQQYAVRFLRGGASGYLTKQSASEELISAIRRVSSGGRYVSPELAESLAFSLGPRARGELHEKLSNRELQVLQLMAEGKTATNIAEHLSLSVKTISTYRSRVLQKLNLSSNADLIRYALQNDLAH